MSRTYIILFIILLALLVYNFSYYQEPFENKGPRARGIIIQLLDGLGNQLYLYAAGKLFEKTFNIPVYLKIDSSAFTHTKKDYRPILFNDLRAISDDNPILENTQPLKLEDKFWSPWSTDDIDLKTDKYLYIYSHWLQYFPVYKEVIPDIRERLSHVMKDLYPDTTVQINSAFVHVRRGDYAEGNHAMYLLDMDYYLKALKVLNRDNGIQNLYIFSNEIKWCKQQKWDTQKNIFFVDEPDELKTLYMMSLCTSGAVIANSTFSTWGAILGAYEKKSIIVYPSKWFGGATTYFPPEWTKI